MRKVKPIIERFWSKVNKTKTCWLWTKSTNSAGYGVIKVYKGNMILSHRLSYEINTGEIPPGKHVLHRCDNPLCVNPKHLFLGSDDDNAKDKVSKGRQMKGEKNWNAILTQQQANEIREAKGTHQEIANKFKIGRTHVTRIKLRELWKEIK